MFPKSYICVYFVDLDIDMFLLTSSYFIKALLNNNGAYSSLLIDIVKIKYHNLYLSVGIDVLGFRAIAEWLDILCVVSYSIQMHHIQHEVIR